MIRIFVRALPAARRSALHAVLTAVAETCLPIILHDKNFSRRVTRSPFISRTPTAALISVTLFPQSTRDKVRGDFSVFPHRFVNFPFIFSQNGHGFGRSFSSVHAEAGENIIDDSHQLCTVLNQFIAPETARRRNTARYGENPPSLFRRIFGCNQRAAG